MITYPKRRYILYSRYTNVRWLSGSGSAHHERDRDPDASGFRPPGAEDGADRDPNGAATETAGWLVGCHGPEEVGLSICRDL